MHCLLRWTCALLVAAGAAVAPAYAQRTLAVPATKGWKHSETGIVLRPGLAGYARTGLIDNSVGEFDVMASFAAPGDSNIVTVYIFNPALMSVPVWFDRAETQILMRDIYGGAQPQGPALAFAPPRATAASGLRRVYVPAKLFKSTGLAMMPLGEWLVAVRISSNEFGPTQLDAKLSEVIAAIGWPQGVAESALAVPVAACPSSLAYAKRARLKKASMNDALFGAILPGIVAEKAAKGEIGPARILCRDLPPKTLYGVYRAADTSDGYVMALGDAGRTLSVAPGLAALIEKSPGYAASFGDVDGSTSIYPSFDKLPHPDQALKLLESSSPISRSTPGGKEIVINAGAE